MSLTMINPSGCFMNEHFGGKPLFVAGRDWGRCLCNYVFPTCLPLWSAAGRLLFSLFNWTLPAPPGSLSLLLLWGVLAPKSFFSWSGHQQSRVVLINRNCSAVIPPQEGETVAVSLGPIVSMSANVSVKLFRS